MKLILWLSSLLSPKKDEKKPLALVTPVAERITPVNLNEYIGEIDRFNTEPLLPLADEQAKERLKAFVDGVINRLERVIGNQIRSLAHEYREKRSVLDSETRDLGYEKLKSSIKDLASGIAVEICNTTEERQTLSNNFRSVRIRVLGSPDKFLRHVMDARIQTAVLILGCTISLIVEFILNVGVLEVSTDFLTSRTISAVTSLISIFSAFFAAGFLTEKMSQRNAKKEYELYYGGGKTDDVLSVVPHVAELSEGHGVRLFNCLLPSDSIGKRR